MLPETNFILVYAIFLVLMVTHLFGEGCSILVLHSEKVVRVLKFESYYYAKIIFYHPSK